MSDADAAAQALAEAVREQMYARDHAARALGITVEAIGPGFARCRMVVRQDMVNGHGTCHGGLTFTLADAAFAYACNACNRATVAQGAQISFIAPARLGEVLTASAQEQSRAGPHRDLRRHGRQARRHGGRAVPRHLLRDPRRGGRGGRGRGVGSEHGHAPARASRARPDRDRLARRDRGLAARAAHGDAAPRRLSGSRTIGRRSSRRASIRTI